MARPKAFDETAALEAAMDRFWKHGYAASSVRDLADCAGITGTSLYNAFGDKRALFVRAIEHYGDTRLRARIERFEAMADPRAAIAGFFEEAVERSLGERGDCGCFLINSALEVAPHDPELAHHIDRRIDEIDRFLIGRVVAAQRAGTIASELDPNNLGRLLLAAFLAIRVLARVRPSRERLEAVARSALQALGPQPEREGIPS